MSGDREFVASPGSQGPAFVNGAKPATSRSFLILHGVNGSGLGHWQTLLSQHLRQRGETVFYPELSGKEEPDREVWLKELREHLASIPDPQDLTVVCHSLSCILWMHHAQDRSHGPVERVVLVAPPGPSIVDEFRPTFSPVPLDAEAFRASARQRLLICTNGDPRCPEKAALVYGHDLGIETVLLPDEAAHINSASGYGEWPGMAALCLSPGFQPHIVLPPAEGKTRASPGPAPGIVHP